MIHIRKSVERVMDYFECLYLESIARKTNPAYIQYLKKDSVMKYFC